MPTPQVGQPLPPFSLPAIAKDGEGFAEQTISNQTLAGRAFVLFIYPKDATSGCTIEVCQFRDLYEDFQKIGVEVIGLSRDKLSAHKRFISNQNLPFPLASDEGAALIKSWNLLVNKTMYGKPVTGVLRTTFLADDTGIAQRIWQKVSPPGHAAEVLETAKQLFSDC